MCQCLRILLVVLAALLPLPAIAQLGGELNAAHAETHWGAELGLGYAIKLGAGFRITPVGGVLLYSGGSSGPYYEDNNGGNPRCRDSSNGEYADSSDCSTLAAHIYGRAEATYQFRKKFAIGGGGRFGSTNTAYGTIAYLPRRKVQLKGNFGPDYQSLGISFGF